MDGCVRGVEEPRQAELERLRSLYAALRQVNHAIVHRRTRTELLQSVCDVLVAQGGFCMTWVGWHDPASLELLPIARAGEEPDDIARVRAYTDERPEGLGPCGAAFRSGEPSVCNGVSDQPATLRWRAEAERRGYGAQAVFPIRLRGEVQAILSVYAEQPGSFRETEMALLGEAAVDLSYALDNLEHEQQREHATQVLQRLVAIVESTDDAIISETLDGKIASWNASAERMFGYSAREAIGCPSIMLVPADRRGEQLSILRHVASGQRIKHFETQRVGKTGELLPVSIAFSPIRSDRDTSDGPSVVLGWSQIVRDISERKEAELALHSLNESLERKVAERTAELEAACDRAESADHLKSAFLATMSHELRTPLNSILGFTGIILQGLAGPLNAEQTKQLNMVKGSARHLLELINDVLDISKIEAGQMEVQCASFELRSCIERVSASVKPLADKKGLALTVELAQAPTYLYSDRRRVEQILINLLNNAIKFSDSGGVSIYCTVTSLAGGLGAGVCVSVKDTGIGIDEQDLALLFRPFRQLDSGIQRQHEGTGLGLAICGRLAQLLGGVMTVESIRGQGSTFSMTLPLGVSS